MCFTLRLHMSAAPTQGGLTQALGAMRKVPHNWIEHTQDWRNEPMAYWVHVERAGTDWPSSDSYSPPAPQPEGQLGYRVLCIESQGFVFRFSSKEQLAECIRVLSQKPLPTSRRLSSLRGSKHGPNSHWLSRLPGRVKSPKVRQRAVDDLLTTARAMAPNNSFKPTPHRGVACVHTLR
jgi:hypothetical protein